MQNKILVLKNYNNFNYYFKIYLSCLLFFGIFWLHNKHVIGNDSSMSEYLINYQGGFTRRGLPGELIYILSKFFDLKFRFVAFLFQSIAYSIFLLFIYKTLKDFKKNLVISFAIFTPLFLLFPIAEIESLGRKETYLYLFFLLLINIKNSNKSNIFVLFILPLVCLIYEEIILFAPFIYVVLILQNKIKDFFGAFKIFFLFFPSILLILYMMTFPLSPDGWILMKDSLLNVFNEKCYMSCYLLVNNDVTFANLEGMINYIWGGVNVIQISTFIFRYFLIIAIGTFPLMLLSYYSTFNTYNFLYIFKLKKIFYLLLILWIPIIPYFIFGGDWGRWVNMMVTFATIFYFYLYSNKLIIVDYKSISKKLYFLNGKKKLIVAIFIIFSFGWNPKSTYVEDVASNPLYKIPYKTYKKISGLIGEP